ncbi:ABC transporter permease [Duganella sp. BJB488]|uniref:ABC transporter permease n=1 Tax=unclassified Duganella TaxID=2636909 RepID=UPI000E34444F|nr:MULTISPECIES: FtsX-like permease family protein [unclassified Duganella]RFP14168.1 ABC transporter permease [Duganella sp. BJB489]RFP17249.1 ABC transporter permease [Duganella sp. BJB488]RFP31961.1 ABC transporter permease [Duganella sp. BJB480]
MEIRPILSALLRNKTGPILVAVQVALSLGILANALHIVQVRQAVSARPSGIANEADVFNLQVRRLKTGNHQEQLAAQHRETDTLRAVAGVTSVAITTQMPLSRSGNYTGLATDRRQVKSTLTTTSYVSPDSLIKTWGLQLVEGRDFLPGEIPEIDETTSQEFAKVVVITRQQAEKLWPGQASYVGKTIFFGTGEGARAVQVVGVIDKLQSPNAHIGERGDFSTLVPARLTGDNANNYTLRAEPGQMDRVIKEAEAALRASSPTPVIVKTRTMVELRRDRYRADQALAWMLVTVSVLLLLITASGIVGMASLWVTQRRKQIGVRRALGARRVDILRYFVTENFMITSVGVAAGVVLALGLNQLLVSQLEMARLPAGYLVAGAAVFWALGVIAVYGPAWRAASISPATATRSA